MNNIVVQRILGAQQTFTKPQPPIEHRDDSKPSFDLSPAVDPEILREKLTERLNPKPKIVETLATQNVGRSLELVHFATLFEFVHWYENNKTSFSDNQIKPLNTLVEARNITLGGCNCDREKRKIIAEDYFKKFWVNNKNTDLLPTLQNILNTKKLILGDFLSFPE